jgi:hypothetical protein
VIVYLLSEMILYLLLMVAFLATPGLLRRWNFDLFTAAQFALENRSYLIMTIIFFVMLRKIILLPFFVYSIDILCDLVPGAMCGAGIIKANSYGNPLLTLKIIVLFLSGLWITINRLDLKAKNYPYIKLKSWFFIVIFILLSVEMGLDILYFTHIETNNPVTCCSVIFGQAGGANALPLGLDIPKLLMLFYLLYVLILLTTIAEFSAGIILANILFLFIAYYGVVYFFGTYIYELPTHKCPFCMLQKPYYYVGYLVWGLLLSGVFFGIDTAMVKFFLHQKSDSLKWISLLLLTLFVLLCSSYVLVYYLKNGVLL